MTLTILVLSPWCLLVVVWQWRHAAWQQLHLFCFVLFGSCTESESCVFVVLLLVICCGVASANAIIRSYYHRKQVTCTQCSYTCLVTCPTSQCGTSMHLQLPPHHCSVQCQFQNHCSEEDQTENDLPRHESQWFLIFLSVFIIAYECSWWWRRR